ncbi:GNAT family N-acetyltransferase [Synechocystis sp. LEGE 06083]|uniref:GNAT family N-acetyltransferase n=1 Tax=Synechocystis sp. LEGE 06083 TaxID=915336 RepID=UPI00187F9430|nr:GNAT family N-acetyltransferase [Synechocystis sp. LEGE 06083]MBE9195937.1 GNAT family N-acetyltransferase [Synechocystis sp. LEGE 06083]
MTDNDPLNLRPTQVDDLTKVLPLVEAFYQHFSYPFSQTEKAQTLRELWDNPDRGCFWLIEQDQGVVGYAYVSFYFSLEFGGRTAFIDELFISSDRRGQGIGSRIIELVEGECRKLNLKALHLESERSNERATALYKRMGFVDYDRRLLTKHLNDC